MNLVNLTINNKSVSVPKGSTILDAAKKLNIKIPTLCHLNMNEVNIVNQCSSCRVCMVSVGKGLVPACGFNSETVKTEIDEYVFTDEIINGLFNVLNAIWTQNVTLKFTVPSTSL